MKNETLKRILSSLVLIPIAFFFIFKGSIFFMFFLIIFFLLISYEWIKMSKNELTKFLGIVYLLFASYSTYLLRGVYLYEFYNFLFIVIICISTDVGGYVFGKLFKGPKLTKISPNKTISGMYGSFIFSIFPIIGIYILEQSGLTDFEKLIFSIKTIILSLVFSLICQLGDIIVSYFKRKNNIKDTGNILPGHGGLLDRIDGLIFLLIFSAILKIFKLI